MLSRVSATGDYRAYLLKHDILPFAYATLEQEIKQGQMIRGEADKAGIDTIELASYLCSELALEGGFSPFHFLRLC